MTWRAKKKKKQKAFVWPRFITACFLLGAGGSFLTLMAPPVAAGSRQNDTFNRFSV